MLPLRSSHVASDALNRCTCCFALLLCHRRSHSQTYRCTPPTTTTTYLLFLSFCSAVLRCFDVARIDRWGASCRQADFRHADRYDAIGAVLRRRHSRSAADPRVRSSSLALGTPAESPPALPFVTFQLRKPTPAQQNPTRPSHVVARARWWILR